MVTESAMITRQRKKSVFRRLWMPLLAAVVLSYFGYHAFSGSFGIWAMDRLEADAARLTVDRDRLKSDREALERRVATVRPASLDADVIDLEARNALNLMRPDEVVVSLGAAQQSQP
jgi:cell division protein FtsB